MISTSAKTFALSPLYAQIARQTAFLNNPALAYMRQPWFASMTEQLRLISAIMKPQMLVMKAMQEQQRQSDEMMRSAASWRRQYVTPIQFVALVEEDETEVGGASFKPDPNFGFRTNRWKADV